MIEKSALFYKAKDAEKETWRQIFMADFASSKRLATSTLCLSLSVFKLASRLTYSALLFSRHPLSVFLPMGNDWRASAHTGLVLFPFGASWSVVSPCASASEIFIPDCCRTAVSPCTGQYRFERYPPRRFAILNPRVVPARVWQLVNGLIQTPDFNVCCCIA